MTTKKQSKYAAKGPGFQYSAELQEWSKAVTRGDEPATRKWHDAWCKKFWGPGEYAREAQRLEQMRLGEGVNA